MNDFLDQIGKAIYKYRTVAISGASFIFFFILSYRDPSTTWNEWLYRWSSLLAALAAITAALITVRQMQQSDAKAETRHEQLVRVQVRADTLRILRAAHPQTEDIEVQIDRIRCAIEDFLARSHPQIGRIERAWVDDTFTQFSRMNLSNVTGAADAIQSAANALNTILRREYFPAARDLFSPEMEMLYREAGELCASIGNREFTIYDTVLRRHVPLQDLVLWRTSIELIHDGHCLVLKAEKLMAEILRMTKEYG